MHAPSPQPIRVAVSHPLPLIAAGVVDRGEEWLRDYLELPRRDTDAGVQKATAKPKPDMPGANIESVQKEEDAGQVKGS